MKVYVTTNAEVREGQEKAFFVLGVYTTLEKAMEALKEQANEDMSALDDEDASKYHDYDYLNGFCLTDGYNSYYYEYAEKVLDDEEEEV